MQVHKKLIKTGTSLACKKIIPLSVIKNRTVRYSLVSRMIFKFVWCEDHRFMIFIKVDIPSCKIIERSIGTVASSYSYIVFCINPVVSNEDEILI